MATRTYINIPEVPYSPYGMPKLAFDKKLLIYARQSQKDQPMKHKESYEQQTVRLVENGISLGWKEENIVVFIENKRKDGQWRKASATLRIDQRSGLQSIVDLIEAGEAKTLMVWAIDRLFRDEDMIEPNVFIKICKRNNVIILTSDDFFDFNNKTRDDARRFRELAQAAADLITKHIRGRMLPAKAQVSKRGEYDGRTIATGFILLDGEKRPKEYTPHAEVIRNLFKRFKELDAQFNLLWREVAPQRELFPPLPHDLPIIGAKKYMFEGAFGLSRSGLEWILTNPMYIGWWYFKEKGKSTVLIRNNHDAIVDEEDFWYSFNRLSKTTITGELNEMRIIKPPARFTRVGNIPVEALLEGIVSSPLPKYHVYVYPRRNKPSLAEYRLMHSMSSSADYDGSCISVNVLDSIFTQKLEYRLRMFQAMDALRSKVEPGKSREQSMYEYLKQMQATIVQSTAGVNTQLEEYRTEAANLDRVLRLGAKRLDDATVIKYSERLARLNVSISQLEGKQDEKEKAEKSLRQTANLLTEASVSYNEMLFERKQNLVRHVTTHVYLKQLATRWFYLEIEWSPFLGISVMDIAYIWRPQAGDNWTDEQIAILKDMYSTETRETLLMALPNRCWQGIKCQAQKIGLSRPWQKSNFDLSIHVSLEDQRFMQENELDFSDLEPKRRVWWKTAAIEKNTERPWLFWTRRR